MSTCVLNLIHSLYESAWHLKSCGAFVPVGLTIRSLTVLEGFIVEALQQTLEWKIRKLFLGSSLLR